MFSVLLCLLLFLSPLIKTLISTAFSFEIVDSSNEDEVGKTVAIIVGVLAGVALFIVLLSFLRRTLGKLFFSPSSLFNGLLYKSSTT